MKNFLFLILISLASQLACASPQAAPANNDMPESAEPTEQTKRVMSDPVMWGMISPFMKKYNVVCRSDIQEPNKNPHWTCLNNMACSYKVTIACFDKKKKDKPTLSFEFAGFDDGNQNEIQNVIVTYSK